MQDYTSRLSDPASRKFETFSYLPPMTDAEIRKQVEYLVKKGWNPAIEHTEPRYLGDSYWYMWKLPMFGETDVDRVLAVAPTNPDALVLQPRIQARLAQRAGGMEPPSGTPAAAGIRANGRPPEMAPARAS